MGRRTKVAWHAPECPTAISCLIRPLRSVTPEERLQALMKELRFELFMSTEGNPGPTNLQTKLCHDVL